MSSGIISGYASVFNIIDRQRDLVRPGAFAKALRTFDKPLMLWMHDITKPIGVWTLLKEDKLGLYVRGELTLGTQGGREAYELLKHGAFSGLSIGYRVKKAVRDTKSRVRIIEEADLFEISLVTFPANGGARASAVIH